MRIVFIAFPSSVHAAKWVSLVADQGWDLHLLPSGGIEYGPHQLFRNVTNWVGGPIIRSPDVHPSVRDRVYPTPKPGPARLRQLLRACPRPHPLVIQGPLAPTPEVKDRAQWAADIISILKPDIVHSMEFQHAGLLTLEAKRRYGPAFPKWIATNWGSDIYLYGRLAAHRAMVEQILQNCDYYSCECNRDVALARSYGLRGKVLPVVPNGGGLDLKFLPLLRQPGPTSARRVIAVKGYHWTMHRAQVALRAIEMCADVLKGYTVNVYSPVPLFMTEIQAQLITQSTGLPIELMPQLSHDEMLALHGSARISISLAISDGICTSFAEALAMGSFPIQSATACADEWLTDGVSGFLVPPEEPEIIADRIRRAVLDDTLVDTAAEINVPMAALRLDRRRVRKVAIRDYYEYVLQDERRPIAAPGLKTVS